MSANPSEKQVGWLPTEKGGHLRGRKTRDTAPELTARRVLHAAGFRYRLHVRLAQGCTPDLVLPRHKVAVFCHGDFWHFCPVHAPEPPGGPNAALWANKRDDNRRRDEQALHIARQLGWQPVVLWECELRADPSVAVERVTCASTVANGGEPPDR